MSKKDDKKDSSDSGLMIAGVVILAIVGLFYFWMFLSR